MQRKWSGVFSAQIMALIVLICGVLAIQLGQVVSYNRGLGWDGKPYAYITAFLDRVITDRGLDSYRIQRIVPSAIVRFGMQVADLNPAHTASIVRAFQWYNLAMLIAGVYAWNGIATSLRLSTRGRWLGFVALFGSFAVLKLAFYLPVLTDVTALVLGLVVFYCYLKGRNLLLFFAALVGCFTWPVMQYIATLLLLFPRSAAKNPQDTKALPAAVYALPAIAVTLVTWYLYVAEYTILPNYAAPIWRAALAISLLAVFCYLAAAMKYLVNREVVVRTAHCFAEMRWTTTGYAFGLWVAVYFILHFVLIPGLDSPMEITFYTLVVMLESIAKPGVFLVAHVVYFGPVVLLAILFWGRVCEVLHTLGLGAVLVMTLGVGLALVPESRQLIAFFPLLVGVTAKAVDSYPPRSSKWPDIAFIAATLVASRFWMPLNFSTFEDKTSYCDFPAQWLFMTSGPWMSASTYAIQGIIAILLLLLFWWLYRGFDNNLVSVHAGFSDLLPSAQAKSPRAHEEASVVEARRPNRSRSRKARRGSRRGRPSP
jgi:hypothetical protein